MLTPADVGRRVVVRRQMGVESGRPVYGDLLGMLESWSNGWLVVRRKDGTPVDIAESDVVAGKPVPPPPRWRDTPPDTGERLALAAAEGWPGLVVERVGDWILQAAEGFTGRANSAIAGGDPGVPLDEALTHVRAFYVAQQRPALVQVIVGSPLESELTARGWVVRSSGKQAFDTSVVQIAPVETMRARLVEAGLPDVTVEFGELDEGWLRRYGRGSIDSAAVRHALTSPENVALARIGEADVPIAIGRGVVTGPWLGLAGIEVAPEHRRAGLARAILAALGRWGAGAGATWAYLQVGTDNPEALALYERLGFRTDHQYRYYAPQD